jgi:hypothetical protein
MTRLLVFALASLLALTGLAAAAPQQQVTIAAQPPDLARDRRLTLYGSIPSPRAKEIVVLQAKECGQSLYHDVARVPTIVGGRYSWEFFYPGITADVRAVWKGQRSVPVRVRDRAFVELRVRGDGQFGVSVRAKTPFAGRQALLQRLTQSGWTTVARVRLTESGVPPGVSYVTSSGLVLAEVPRGSLVRAVFPRSQARPCYLAGYSNMLRAG